MMVIFLTGLVSMILMRTLRNDYAKYAREDDDLESLVSSEPGICSTSIYLYVFHFVCSCYLMFSRLILSISYDISKIEKSFSQTL